MTMHASIAIDRRESELLAAAQAGNVAAFEDLVGVHADRLYSLVLGLVRDRGEAEDVLQETLLRAWRGIAGFRGRAMIATWLYPIAVNEANRALERRSRQPSPGPMEEKAATTPTAARQVSAGRGEQGALSDALAEAITGLAPHYRTALILRDVEGLSTREAAEMVGVGEAAFKSRLHHAREKVRAGLGDTALLTATD